jgi:hypothetical protein
MDREELLTKTPQELLDLLGQGIITIKEWSELPMSVRLEPNGGEYLLEDEENTTGTNSPQTT